METKKTAQKILCHLRAHAIESLVSKSKHSESRYVYFNAHEDLTLVIRVSDHKTQYKSTDSHRSAFEVGRHQTSDSTHYLDAVKWALDKSKVEPKGSTKAALTRTSEKRNELAVKRQREKHVVKVIILGSDEILINNELIRLGKSELTGKARYRARKQARRRLGIKTQYT